MTRRDREVEVDAPYDARADPRFVAILYVAEPVLDLADVGFPKVAVRMVDAAAWIVDEVARLAPRVVYAASNRDALRSPRRPDCDRRGMLEARGHTYHARSSDDVRRAWKGPDPSRAGNRKGPGGAGAFERFVVFARGWT